MIELTQGGATTCIDSSYNINYNGTELTDIWVCDTTNAVCCLVWHSGIDITIGCIQGACGGCGKWAGLANGTGCALCGTHSVNASAGTSSFTACCPVTFCIPITNNGTKPIYVDGTIDNTLICGWLWIYYRCYYGRSGLSDLCQCSVIEHTLICPGDTCCVNACIIFNSGTCSDGYSLWRNCLYLTNDTQYSMNVYSYADNYLTTFTSSVNSETQFTY